MLRILIIEDEKSVRDFLAHSLEEKGHKIFMAIAGNEGLQKAIETRPDLIVLDLGLPDISGIEVLQKIRTWSPVPIIILTANSDDKEKIKALDIGADDYLTKPYNISELEARIRAVSRRVQKNEHILKIEIHSLELNLDSHLVFIKDSELHLTLTEFLILKILMMNQEKIVTHRLVLKEICAPNSTEHTQYLRVYVGQLRKKLATFGIPSTFITTEVGIGYRLKY